MTIKEKKPVFEDLYQDLNKTSIEINKKKIQKIIKSDEFLSNPIEKQLKIIQQLTNYLKIQEKNITNGDPLYSDDVPESISMNFKNHSPFNLNPKKLTPAAFDNITTLELITKLNNTVQSYNQNINIFNPKPEVDQEDPNYSQKIFVLDQIELARKYSRDIHYSIISLLIQIHLYISKLIDNINDLDNFLSDDKFILLLYFKKQIEFITIRYNQHDPAFNLLQEENKIRSLKVVKSILFNLKDLFLLKKWGKTANSIKSTNNISKSNINHTKTTQTVNSIKKSSSNKSIKNNDKSLLDALNQFSDYISVSSKKTIFSVGVSNTSPPPPPTQDSSDENNQINNSDSSSIPSSETSSPTSTITQKNFSMLNLEPVNFEIDIILSDITNPEKNFSKFLTFFNKLINYGVEFFSIIKDFCYKANFNLFLNNFGSSLPKTNNSAEIEEIYADLNFDLLSDFKKHKTIKPMIIIETVSQISTFLGKYSKGHEIFSVSLLPGEKKEIRIKTTELLKEEREKSQTILDSKSQIVKDSFQKQLEQEKNKNQTMSTEANQYLDAQKTAETSRDILSEDESNLHKEWSAEAHADLSASGKGDLTSFGIPVSLEATASVGGSANAGQTTDIRNLHTQNQHQGLSENLSQGVSNQLNTGREESARVLQNALANHCQEISSKRDVTVSETSKQQLEESKEQGTVQHLENQNKNSVQNFLYCTTLQEYFIIHHIVDVNIIFSNGINWEKYPLSSINILIDKYIKPECTELKQTILDLAKISCRIVDYKNRVIDILEPDSKVPMIKRKKYINFLLDGEKYKLDIEDLEFSDKFKYIDGVLINKFTQTIKQPGSIVIPKLEEGNCMDSLSKREMDARIKIIEEELRKLEIFNQILASNLKFAESIGDEKLQAKIRFELFNNTREILDKTFLADFMRRRIPNDNEDEINIKGDD